MEERCRLAACMVEVNGRIDYRAARQKVGSGGVIVG